MNTSVFNLLALITLNTPNNEKVLLIAPTSIFRCFGTLRSINRIFHYCIKLLFTTNLAQQLDPVLIYSLFPYSVRFDLCGELKDGLRAGTERG